MAPAGVSGAPRSRSRMTVSESASVQNSSRTSHHSASDICAAGSIRATMWPFESASAIRAFRPYFSAADCTASRR